MEAVTNSPTSNCHILNNSPALHSLKRQQLVQLCKRNGIKATGKNSEIVEKLKAHASTHPFVPSSLGGQPSFSDDDDGGDKENRRAAVSRPSEVWSVIEDNSREVQRVRLELKDVKEEVEQEMTNMSPLKDFGISSSGEYGSGTTSSKASSMTSSIKAFANSLKRGGSKSEAPHDVRMKQNFYGLRQTQESKMSTEPIPSITHPMHTEEPPVFDTLSVTYTPYHTQPQTYPPLLSSQSLNADDSQDHSMLDLGASTIRLVTTAPTAPSPPMLRPFTPSVEPSYSPGSPSVPALYPSLPVDQDSDPLPPGSFPGAFSIPSVPPNVSSPVPPPFIFGSPAHRISNTEFNSAATSVLAEMNARLGLTGTTNEVGMDLLQKRQTAEAVPLPELQERPRTDVTRMFDRAHERQFQKMEGLGEWYARRNTGSPGKSGPEDVSANRKRKSGVLGGPYRRLIGPSNARARRTSRVVTPGTRRSLVAAAEAEVMDGRKMKRVRISIVDGRDKKAAVATDNRSLDDSGDEDEETTKTHEERERERAAIKKRLEVSRARRRSSMGRVSVGGGKPPIIPNQAKKGTVARFGFLSSAKNIVKSVWKGVGSGAPKQNSTLPTTGPSQGTIPPATKKFTSNLLMRPGPAAKPGVPKPPVAKVPTAKPNTSLRLPSMGIGLGRKTSTRTGTNSTAGTRSSTTSSGTLPITPSSGSGIPAGRRGAIPSFQQPLSRISQTNSLTSVKGTPRSRTSTTGTGGSRGSSAANSIGLKKSKILSGVRPSDMGNGSTNSAVRKRTSTLFAHTASSLAKMQSTVRPLTLSNAASRPSVISAESKALAKVSEQRSAVQNGLPSFTFTSPLPVGGSTTSKGIFSNGAPTFSPPRVFASETDAPKPRVLPARRPRISRSRVIARVGAQRAASRSSLTRTPSGRRSFNAPKPKGSLGMRVSGIGAKSSVRNSSAMSAQRLRQSEILRRRSKLSEVSPAPLDRDKTPDDGNGDSTEGDQSYEDPGVSLDFSMEG